MALGIRNTRIGSTGNAPTSQTAKDEVYALSGLNMVTPDQIIDTATRRYNKVYLGQSPYTINSRMLARDSGEQRSSVRTRKGSSLANGMEQTSVSPVISISNTATSTGETMFSTTVQIADYFIVPSYSLSYGYVSLSYIELYLRKTTGYVESINVRIYTDNSGVPGTLLATSSFSLSDVTGTSGLVKATFMDAPDLHVGDKIWMVLDLTGTSTVITSPVQCFAQHSATGHCITRSIASGNNPWTSTGFGLRFTTSCFKSGAVLSAFRRNVPGETPVTIVATGYGDVITLQDNHTEALLYAYSGGYEQYANRFRFAQVDNYTLFVNGAIQPQQWDGTSVTAISSAPTNADHVFIWMNRVFMRAGNKFMFSDILTTDSNINSWPSVNYFYPNTPDDPDAVIGSFLLKEQLFVFTKRTKYRVTMSDTTIATLDILPMAGTRGGVSQDLIDSDGEFIYFIGNDLRLYAFNGVTDVLLSDFVEPEIRAQQSAETLSTLHVWNSQIRLYYSKDTSNPSNMLLYDLIYHEWFMDTGRAVALSITYPLEGFPLIEFSSQTTMVFNGEDPSYADCGKPISFKYWTNYKAYGSGAAKKRIKRFRPILKITSRPYTMRIGKDMDFTDQPDMRDYLVSGASVTYGGGAKYGDGSKYGSQPLVDNHAGMSGRSRHVQYRFEKNGVNTPVELYGYIALFKEGTNK